LYIGNTTAYSIRPSTAGGLGHFIHLPRQDTPKAGRSLILLGLWHADRIFTKYLPNLNFMEKAL